MITLLHNIDIHPQYITDDNGKKLSVVLPISEFDALLDALVRSIQTSENSENTPSVKSSAARFKGLLSENEADKYLDTSIKRAMNGTEIFNGHKRSD